MLNLDQGRLSTLTGNTRRARAAVRIAATGGESGRVGPLSTARRRVLGLLFLVGFAFPLRDSSRQAIQTRPASLPSAYQAHDSRLNRRALRAGAISRSESHRHPSDSERRSSSSLTTKRSSRPCGGTTTSAAGAPMSKWARHALPDRPRAVNPMRHRAPPEPSAWRGCAR
jgi:hypothetical protein